MKDKGSREAPFFLLKISHRNAYRQANIFKVFGFSEGGESKKANCTTFLRIASVLYTGRHALRPVMCMERFYPKECYVESLSAYARQFLGKINKPDVDIITGIAPAIAIEQKVIQYLYVGISLLDIVRRIRTWSVTLCRIYKLPEIG